MGDATLYLRLYFLGTIPTLLFNMGAGILRAVGDAKRPLYYLVVCCLMNVVLDLLFVAGLHMGVAGAAIATTLANLTSALLILRQLARAQGAYRLHPPGDPGPRGPPWPHILGIGVPAAIESAMYAASSLLIQVPINTLGTEAVAAWSATSKVDGVYWCPDGLLRGGHHGLRGAELRGGEVRADAAGGVRVCPDHRPGDDGGPVRAAAGLRPRTASASSPTSRW